ncbi:hypothetical protein Tco_0007947 [Tanacetum coccineum]
MHTNNIFAVVKGSFPPMLCFGQIWHNGNHVSLDDIDTKSSITTHEIWIAIERLQQGESLNIQYVKTNLFWEFGKFTSHDGDVNGVSYLLEIFTMLDEGKDKETNLDSCYDASQCLVSSTTSTRMVKNANPLALVAAAQPHPDPYYQAPKSYKSYAPTSKASTQTRSHATTRQPQKQSDWLADTDEEIDEQEFEAHYSFMAKIQEVPTADS